MTARVLTWNLERTQPLQGRGAEAVDRLFSMAPDVMVLTESRTTFPERGGHVLWSKPPRTRRHDADERTVLAWSRHPFTDIDRVGAPGLDTNVQVPTVVVGDFNQRIPRVRYGNRRAAAELAATFEPFDIVDSRLEAWDTWRDLWSNG